MAGSGSKNADVALLAGLTAGRRVTDAAVAAEVTECAANRRVQDEAFHCQLIVARSDMVNRAVGQLADMAVSAATPLRAILSSKSDNVRLGSSRPILELGLWLHESTEFAAEAGDDQSGYVVYDENWYGPRPLDGANGQHRIRLRVTAAAVRVLSATSV